MDIYTHAQDAKRKPKQWFWMYCRQPFPYRITEGLPVIRPGSMPSAKVTAYKPTSGESARPHLCDEDAIRIRLFLGRYIAAAA